MVVAEIVIILIVASLFYFTFYSAGTRCLSAVAARRQVEASAVTPDFVYCPLWEIRRTEEKMVLAGIIRDHEMSVCDNDRCEDCQTSRGAISAHIRMERSMREYEYAAVRKARIKEMQSEYSARKALPPANSLPARRSSPTGSAWNECSRCGMKTIVDTCRSCDLAMRAKKPSRYVEVEGTRVKIPNNVPAFAEGTIVESDAGIIGVHWSWCYENDDMTYTYNQVVNNRAPEIGTVRYKR